MPNRIRELREDNRLTLLELSKKLGVSESTVQRYESGNIKNLKYKTMVDLANIFNCNPAYLMGWSDSFSGELPPELRPDESDLLDNYNTLNTTGKHKAQEYVSDLTENRKYTNASPEPLLYAAHERTDIEVTDEMRKHDNDIMNDEDF